MARMTAGGSELLLWLLFLWNNIPLSKGDRCLSTSNIQSKRLASLPACCNADAESSSIPSLASKTNEKSSGLANSGA